MLGEDGAPAELQEPLKPDSDHWTSGPVSLFVPYQELPLDSGERAMRLILAVIDESGQVLGSYSPIPFTMADHRLPEE